MNYNKFFALAKQNKIDVSEISYSKSTSLQFSLFQHQLDQYSTSSQSKLIARGIYNGKLGFAATENLTSSGFDYLVDEIKKTATLIEKEEKPILFKGSKKYQKRNIYNKVLPTISVDEKIKKIRELEEATYAVDKRVLQVVVQYEESEEERVLANSYGLNLKNKQNYFAAFVQAVAKDGDDVKSDYEVLLESDFSKFNPKELAEKVVAKVVAKFNGTPIKAKAYNAVLSSDVTATFLSTLINSWCSAESVQKHTSLLEGKLNAQILSKRISIEEKPLEKNLFFTYFDDEGVATQNKKIVEKGILKTYLYNLETAAKDNVETTGNAARQGSKMGIASVNLTLKPGRLSEEELFAKIGNGVYVTSVSGLHAGLNPQSGDFSLEAEGFHIIDGKKAGPLTLITIGGNLLKVFNDVIAVGNNSKLQLSSTTAPSIAVRKIMVSST